MLSEMVKFSSQHRALYCYLIMSVWIFLIVAGMYKYIVTEEIASMPKPSALRRENFHNSFRDVKLKKIINKYCNAPENIHQEAEGLDMPESWQLQGVIIGIRHGDRGPLTHIRNIDKISCHSPQPSSMLRRYQEFILNATGGGHAPWAQAPGPFHNFPLLPGAPMGACRLGQLTPLGVEQLLATGAALSPYAAQLGWDTQPQTTTSDRTKSQNENSSVKSRDTVKTSDAGSASTKQQTKPLIKGIAREAKSPQSRTTPPTGRPVEGDIVVHSTRYRRALQSALALVWGLLGGQGGAGGPGGVGGAVAKESPSLAFCSTDCACPAADNYAKMVSLELRDRLESHPAIEELMSQLSKIVFQSASQVSKNPHILEDALLTYICHAAPLPCMERPIEQTKPSHKTTKGTKKYSTLSKAVSGNSRALLQDTQDSLPKRSLLDMFLKGKDPNPKAAVLDFDNQMEKEKLEYYQHKLMENADVNYQDVVLVKRNMDGDFNFNGEVQNNGEVAPADNVDEYEDKENGERDHEGNSSPGDTETLCVRKEQVTGLFAYTDWEMKQHAKSKNLKKASLLRAYGMIRHIVQYLLKMISEGKPKVVLFSGHDKTLQYLSLALGLAEDNFLHIHYASRMVIEIYRNVDKENLKTAKYDNRYPRITPTLDFYLRLVMNGRDVTNQLSFCRGKKSLTIDKPNVNKTVKGKDYKYYLCRIENIIRFTHEDYFSIFNATNFKDACIVH